VFEREPCATRGRHGGVGVPPAGVAVLRGEHATQDARMNRRALRGFRGGALARSTREMVVRRRDVHVDGSR
jgi:hypothetical protein